jgi:ClpP class serine protease
MKSLKRGLRWFFSWRGLSAVLFVIFFVVPVIETFRLERLRANAVAALEQKRGSRVIMLIHRQESVNVLGIPVVRYIDINDSEELLRGIRFTGPDTPIDLILHTPGGLVLAASQIARALMRHPAKATVFVPHYAMSGGTLIALAADGVIMDRNAVLGPVDPQLGDFPAASVLEAVERKPIARIEDVTLVLADQSRKAIAQVTSLVQELLTDKMPPAKAKEVAHRLASGTWTHDFPITAESAKDLIGLPVSTEMPEEVYRLTSLYRPAHGGETSVYYLPGPRHEKGDNQKTNTGVR